MDKKIFEIEVLETIKNEKEFLKKVEISYIENSINDIEALNSVKNCRYQKVFEKIDDLITDWKQGKLTEKSLVLFNCIENTVLNTFIMQKEIAETKKQNDFFKENLNQIEILASI